MVIFLCVKIIDNVMMVIIIFINSNFYCLNIRIYINLMINMESQVFLDKVFNIRKIKIMFRIIKEMWYFVDLIS